MMIGDIFERPIDRDIDTVIVAGQNREEKIFQEFEIREPSVHVQPSQQVLCSSIS